MSAPDRDPIAVPGEVSPAPDGELLPDIVYSREMGLDHRDFFRLLPRAMGEHAYRIDGRTVNVQLDSGTVQIVIGEEQLRRIALLAIPYAEVCFTFRGVTRDAQLQFKKHFDLHFQRGGG